MSDRDYKTTDNEDKKTSKKRKKKKEEEKTIKQTIIEYVVTIAVVLGIGLFVMNFVIVNAEIPSGSMENTIMPGERIFGNRLAYNFKDPERYDIIIFKYPDDESQLFIKRIIGLPGETVIITGGKVYAVPAGTDTGDESDNALLIENPMMYEGTKVLDDSYIPEPMSTNDPTKTDLVFRVPEDSYFVLGDNRNHSRDSRYWNNSFVARDKIVGEAGFRYWPITKIGIIGYDGDDR
jgi:signal peptidase I